jgi:Uri superfamily endonuclease
MILEPTRSGGRMSRSEADPGRPLADIPENRGYYLFLVRLLEPVRLSVGAIGEHELPAGWYVYTGRARRNLMQRVRRHFRPRKRVRWHIDRLIEAPGARPLGAVVLGLRDHPDWSECFVNQKVGAILGAEVPIPGFGAGDCTEGCRAHLWYVGRPLSLLQLAQVSSRSAVVLPRGRGPAPGPSPDWPLGMPRYFQVDTPDHD